MAALAVLGWLVCRCPGGRSFGASAGLGWVVFLSPWMVRLCLFAGFAAAVKPCGDRLLGAGAGDLLCWEGLMLRRVAGRGHRAAAGLFAARVVSIGVSTLSCGWPAAVGACMLCTESSWAGPLEGCKHAWDGREGHPGALRPVAGASVLGFLGTGRSGAVLRWRSVPLSSPKSESVSGSSSGRVLWCWLSGVGLDCLYLARGSFSVRVGVGWVSLRASAVSGSLGERSGLPGEERSSMGT